MNPSSNPEEESQFNDSGLEIVNDRAKPVVLVGILTDPHSKGIYEFFKA